MAHINIISLTWSILSLSDASLPHFLQSRILNFHLGTGICYEPQKCSHMYESFDYLQYTDCCIAL